MTLRDHHTMEHFIRALRRRMVAVRAVEAAGIGAAIAGGFSVVLAVCLMCVGRDAGALPGISLLVGAGLGAAVSLARVPTLMSAAAEADRQLGLSDLLATALSRRDATDPWERAVIAMADARCCALSPRDVLLARLGARAWSGIGLTAALVLAVGALSASPESSHARSTEGVDPMTVDSVARPRESPQAAHRAGSEMNPSLRNRSERAIAPERIDDMGAVRSTSSQASRQAATAGGGNAISQTPSAAVPDPGRATAVRGDLGHSNGLSSGGDGMPAKSQPGSDPVASSKGGGSSPSEPPSMAQTPASERSGPAAADDVTTDGLPDRYRDVMRRYFDGK